MQSSPPNSVPFHNLASLPAPAASSQAQLASAMANPHVHVVKAISTATCAIDGFVIWKALEQTNSSAAYAVSVASAP
ncbi:hypothetical protein MMC15_008084 [Xylographa vitiligo]|nr:hypothetical protein [Xylographa vitiligo]